MNHKRFRGTPEARFGAKVDKRGPDECWNWLAGLTRPRLGYGRFMVAADRIMVAHRYAWELAAGRSAPSDMLVCHRCDNSLCCNPAHLFLGTQTDNMSDAARKGRLAGRYNPKGDANPRTIIPDSLVTCMRMDYAFGGGTPTQIAAAYGLDAKSGASLVTGHKRRHLPNWQAYLEPEATR